ncbi:MAG TPA: ATP-binding protein, partial [Tahibacter sp.]|nr:ATP-binding protein [Tahibacter sp.]
DASSELERRQGYAAGFESLLRDLDRSLPRSEHVRVALREEDSVFPGIALRELVANALIHQDITQRGAGPMIEVFDDRVEISNPGAPLVDTVRMIDAPPRSRNEHLATFMRRIGICEERGSGIDKVIDACELAQLPAPEFKVVEGFTKVTLFAPRPLKSMSRADRIRACYQHAVLLWVSSRQMTNSSIRARFGIDDRNAAQASRIIREAVEDGLIREFDLENRSNKLRRYVPFWA